MKGCGKDYYVLMENGGFNNVLNYFMLYDYVLMDNEMCSNVLNNFMLQDYILMDVLNILFVMRRFDGLVVEKSGLILLDYY